MNPGYESDSPLDVLHLVFWAERRHSIRKIAENIIRHNPDLHQRIVSLPNPDLDLTQMVNSARPRIIHLHYGGPHEESKFLSGMHYRPRIVHTVHGSIPSIFTEIADRIVCIDDVGLRRNDPKKSILIENTVDVSDFAPHAPNDNGICNAHRFSPDKMLPETFGRFAALNSVVYFYGADDLLSLNPQHNAALCREAEKYENIVCLPFDDELEAKMVRHSFFSYLPAAATPTRCYGLPVMEAAGLGMPIVAFPRVQARQPYIVHGENGLIAFNEDEFFSYCAELLRDRGLYLSMCEHARRRAASLSNAMPEEYGQVYRELLATAGDVANGPRSSYPAGSSTSDSLVIICPDTNIRLWAERMQEAPIGGGKSAILQMAAAWARAGHQVTLAGASVVEEDGDYRVRTLENAAGRYDTAIYVTGSLGRFDLPAIDRIEARTRIFWLNGPGRVSLPPGPMPDLIIAPARFLARRAIEEWGFPADRLVVIPGGATTRAVAGVDSDERDDYAVVFASHPHKGLDNAIRLIERVRPDYPALHLDVFGSAVLHGDHLDAGVPGDTPDWVRFVGALPQRTIERRMPRYGLMLYLTSYVDSFSPVTSEAMTPGR